MVIMFMTLARTAPMKRQTMTGKMTNCKIWNAKMGFLAPVAYQGEMTAVHRSVFTFLSPKTWFLGWSSKQSNFIIWYFVPSSDSDHDDDHDCADDRLVLFSVVTDVATTDLRKNGRVFTNSNQAGSDSVKTPIWNSFMLRYVTRHEQESLHLVVNMIMNILTSGRR